MSPAIGDFPAQGFVGLGQERKLATRWGSVTAATHEQAYRTLNVRAKHFATNPSRVTPVGAERTPLNCLPVLVSGKLNRGNRPTVFITPRFDFSREILDVTVAGVLATQRALPTLSAG
jgi:hypothetical protein